MNKDNRIFGFDQYHKQVIRFDLNDFTELTESYGVNESDVIKFETKFAIPDNVWYVGTHHANDSDANHFQYYAIQTRQESDDLSFSYEGVEYMYDDLDVAEIITDKRPNNKTIGELLDIALLNSGWSRASASPAQESQETASMDFYYESPLSALSKIKEAFPNWRFWSGVELDDTGDVASKTVWYGTIDNQNTPHLVYEDVDFIDFVKKVDYTNVYNRVYPRGKGLETEGGGNSRRLTIADLTLSTSDGDPVDKPRGQEWYEIEHDGPTRTKVLIMENEVEANSLFINSYNLSIKYLTPLVTYRTQIRTIDPGRIGEWYMIKNRNNSVQYLVQLGHAEYDWLQDITQNVSFSNEGIFGQDIRDIVHDQERQLYLSNPLNSGIY